MPALVSVVVPVRNGRLVLADLLASLRGLTWPADRREFLIVDNGSTDGSGDIARAAGFRVVEEPERGASAARNRGVRETRGDIIAFTDADCAVTRGWLEALTAPFGDPAVGGVGGRTDTFPPRTAAERHAVRTRHLDAERHLSHPRFPFAPTANAAFRREVFERIGGFDPGFPWGEPVDFCKRLVRDTSFRLAYAPRAVVFHRGRATLEGYLEQQTGYGYSLALLAHKYRDEVRWGPLQEMRRESEIVRAALLLPVGLVASVIRGEPGGDPWEARWIELRRLIARRRGFRRAVRERGLRLA